MRHERAECLVSSAATKLVRHMTVLEAEPPAHDEATPGPGAHCVDCPATRQALLAGMIGASSACCQLETRSIEAREVLPLQWAADFGLAIVRRGLLVRQRTDRFGVATAIDLVGPGGAFPIEPPDRDSQARLSSAGYAVTRVLVCLTPAHTVHQTVLNGSQDALDLYTLQRDAIYRMERLADARARNRVSSRVAALLCALQDTASRHRKSSKLPAGIMQRDFGVLLAARHESVCRALGAFARRGLIANEDGAIRIIDRAALEAL